MCLRYPLYIIIIIIIIIIWLYNLNIQVGFVIPVLRLFVLNEPLGLIYISLEYDDDNNDVVVDNDDDDDVPCVISHTFKQADLAIIY